MVVVEGREDREENKVNDRGKGYRRRMGSGDYDS
jgi:hypothetical protein